MPSALFLFDLIQDVAVLRPLFRTLSIETGLALGCFYSWQFAKRDKEGNWVAELEAMCAEAGIEPRRYGSEREALDLMRGHVGMVFSGSESNLPAHRVNHRIFQAAPAPLTRITVQHGHECVGFNQNHEQTLAHGSAVRFAADVLCGWTPADRMRHLAPSERSKYFHLGSPALLNRLYGRFPETQGAASGLVCENLHSVRMRMTGDFQTVYIDTLRAFARSQLANGRLVALRPHPGGQFVLRNKVALPDGVVLANNPMYHTDLKAFAYGISAPSSILIDMVQAGIPTAVWTDEASVIDTSGYEGLTRVSTVQDWIDFAEAAIADPQPFLARQQAFLKRAGLDIEPAAVRRNLLALAGGVAGRRGSQRPIHKPKRLLIVANGVIPTVHISFLKPLAPLVERGEIEIEVLTEHDVHRARKDRDSADPVGELLGPLRPDLTVFCRYSGPLVRELFARLREAGVPTVFHLDDDLLNVPSSVGEAKFRAHNSEERTSTIRFLIDHADLVYCSTAALRLRLAELGFGREIEAGKIYFSSEIVSAAELRPVRTIGIMGNDKSEELNLLVPQVAATLDRHPDIEFEIFGSMGLPEGLRRFGSRVRAMPAVSNYDDFVEQFHRLRWDIGLCPLSDTPFNRVKANTKWIDYTAIGAAVIASSGTAYDDSCAGDCGILVDGLGGWGEIIEALIADPQRRFTLVANAQQRVREEYSLQTLAQQVLAMFDLAGRRYRLAGSPRGAEPA